MRRVIQRQITTTQIVFIEVTWAEENGANPTSVEEVKLRLPETIPVRSRKPRQRRLPRKKEADNDESDVSLST